MTIYFLGGGNMAAAIARGLAAQGGYALHIVDRGEEKRERLAHELGVPVSATLPELSAEDVLVAAVKPQDMQAACAGVETNGALVLSVAAGLSVDTLSRYLGGTRRIVRIMPNTPAAVGLGVSGLFAGDGASAADKQLAAQIMLSVGQVMMVEDEDRLHAVTGITGSGPAYVFYLLEALQKAAEMQGFDEETAKQLSLATFKGAVELASHSAEDFGVLRQNVTSKGGTTFAALETFKARGVAESIAEGVEACVARSHEITRQFEAV